MPVAIPSWRKVLLIPDAMPARSWRTVETAVDASGALTIPIPMPPITKPGQQARPVRAGVDAAHRPHRDRVQRQPGAEQDPDRHARREPARDRRGDERDQAQRQEAEARLQRREPDDVLQVERQVEEHREHRRGDREGGRLRADERGPGEEREVDHRRRVSRVCDATKTTSSTAAAAKSAEDHAARPAALVALDQREDQAEEAADQRHEAERVEPAVLGVARLAHLLRRERDGGGADREVDEEDPAPREPRGEHAAGERADRDRGADRRAPDPERGAALLAVELLRDQRERGREHHRAADSLHAAGDDQEERVVGERRRRARRP